jgi:hypothetical protein
MTATYLGKLCEKFILIKIDLGQKLDSIVTAVFCRWAHGGGIVEFQGATSIHMAILRRRGAGKDFANEVDDSITAGAEFTNDFEFLSKILMVGDRCLLGGMVSDETKKFTLKGNSLAHQVTGGQNIVYG